MVREHGPELSKYHVTVRSQLRNAYLTVKFQFDGEAGVTPDQWRMQCRTLSIVLG